ncbi:histidine kinase [Alkalihalobacillus alcalophilus ATCC 27647 = CGMCC 1.3604]|uniref:Signal transduction histidine-protein kinase/phosphatase DegS n=1 Tax=Alkalihalobacillus alcalophilus ATCC 27647 = CGMCC 1.3604 TaxID=1218173 RepID=A0A094YSR7_ALKAL|nr:sensor histidine kinase [Alkalihalobacillus alcalophilus]KGA96532.1 histidine kinase [Alkalihalobacillus alcalophilus ATCC 27647 = CGMCC 1.3604]MED1561506.1 histidine kinase [Alkalihalobacillus alcalophilus]THG88670.1 histidine kinase [Alkalihalobacillus alcalophilus ATCC 27647 = CGMCC 1.3604]
MSGQTVLEDIIEKTIHTVGQSREQIFEISEKSRQEYVSLQKELLEIRLKVTRVIENTDKTELYAKYARNRLAEVSKNFEEYSTKEVQAVYEQANNYQVELAVLRHEELQLRERRDTIERRIVDLGDTVERAEQLAGQMSVVFNFLAQDLKNVGEVIQSAKEKQAFGLKIIEAQEAERKRLSREIHDGPAQMMANVMLRSELIERIHKEEGIDEALKEIRSLKEMVRSSLAEVRRIIYDLRPMALDDLGLMPTLSKYLKNFEEHHQVIVSFAALGKEQRLPQEFEVAMFRLVQEGVQNACKHAEPTQIQVKIEFQKTKVILVIKDNGKGFDPSTVKEGSFGLMGMKERVNMLKGDLNIQSHLNVGTTLLIQIPLMTDES